MSDAKLLHPSPAELAAFGLGQLAPEVQAEIERHVVECIVCCQALRQIPDDSLLARLRAQHTTLDGSAFAVHTTPYLRPELDAALPQELADHPRYRIIKVLGAGGMGVVYQAEHRLMQRQVALKVISRQLISDPTAVERFLLEVRAAGRLAHPNIVSSLDADQAGDRHFLVMEFVDGVSLARLVEKKGPLPVANACNYVRQAAQGLQHAFEHRMVHRDIKPQNLMLTRKGQVKILDFGLARFASERGPTRLVTEETAPDDSSEGLTEAGAVLGTPDYIAPEQASDSHRADIRADIYSLGCTLYYLLTGRVPFPQGSITQKLSSHINQAPVPLGELRGDLPPQLGQLIESMMAKDPAQRPQTPTELARALAPFARSSVAPVQVPLEEPAIPTATVSDREAETLPASQGRTTQVPRRKKRGRSLSRKHALLRWRSPLIVAAVVLGLVASLVLGVVAFKKIKNLAGLPGTGSRPSRVLFVLPSSNFHYPDYGPVRRVLEEGGVQVVVASTTLAEIKPENPSEDPSVKPDILLDSVNASEFDAVIFGGGWGVKEYTSKDGSPHSAHRVIWDMQANDKLIAALCTGTAVLAESGVLRGKQATCHPNVPHEIKKACGAQWVNQPVVVSGRIITGKDPAAAKVFAQTLLQNLPKPP